MTAAEDDPPRHPIAVVAERTGLSQDVLRAWERRFGVVRPGRAERGQRLYSDADITRLGLLRAATKGGRGISQVASLATEEVAALVEEDIAARDSARQRTRHLGSAAKAGGDAGRLLDESLALARGWDQVLLDAQLRRAAARLGMPAFLEEVGAPLLRLVGNEWSAGRMTAAQEHMVSSVVQQLAMETLRTFSPRAGAPRMLVATPAGERHATGAAFVAALAAMEGWHVLHLGSDLPAAEIALAARAADVRLVALSLMHLDDRPRVLGEMRAVRAALPANVVVLAGGAGAATMSSALLALGMRVETSMPALVAELRSPTYA